MKKIKYLFFLPLMAALVFTGCKDDDDGASPSGNNGSGNQLSKEELIAGTTSKIWIKTKSVINGFDITAQIDPCNSDDHYTYKRDKNYTHTEGPTKCDPADNNIRDVGTWELDPDNDNIINLEINALVIPNTIVELTETTMTLDYKLGGATYLETFTAQ